MKNSIVYIVLLFTILVEAQVTSKPNVIVIFNDDLGYQDLGCYGSPNIKTPRIDQLAKEGTRFTSFYAASSVCSASRAALLTGCYPQRVGIEGVLSASAKQGLNPKYTTIAKMLKTAGYATAAVGKWHLGDQEQFLPTNNGFDSYYGIPYSNDMYPSKNSKYATNCLFNEGYDLAKIQDIFVNMTADEKQPAAAKNKVPLMRNLECIEFPVDQTTITKRYANESINFIKQSVKEKKPFFLYLANSMPHTPLFASEDFNGKSKRGLYGDVVEEIDFNTGRILDELKTLGIDKNTIVIFSSDNGPWLSKGEDGGSALPFFEGKFTSFEGGFRVPFIVKWPKGIKGNAVCNEISSTIDVLPTLANIVGVNLTNEKLDGKIVSDLWKGNQASKSPHPYFFMIYNGQAVRYGDWKYHKKQFFTTSKKTRKEESPALYNIKQDVGETKNVIAQYPEIAAQMSKALEEHLNYIKE
jgi:arylsulfatase A